jgi:uncharacterized membrane protein
LGIPLAAKKVAPNRWYGVRTTATLKNSETWYRVNVMGGKALVAAGMLSAIVQALIFTFWSGDIGLRDHLILMVPLGILAGVTLMGVFAE